MKKIALVLILLAGLATANVFAQSTMAGAVNGMTLNGSTGLVIVPDARIAWGDAKFGLDVGYGIAWDGGDNFDSLPRAAISLFRLFEVTAMLQIDSADVTEQLKNFVLGTKFKLLEDRNTALAIGGDIEFVNQDRYTGNSGKVYLAATYGGNFFGMPAVTTATIGWQLWEVGSFSSQFVYGMGFSMSLFPSAFKNIVYWVTDFANFSYSVQGARVNAGSRGAFNTGIRIDPIKSGRFNLVIDVIGIDLLDDGSRGIAATVSGGLAF
jgi:hypothetical protein